MATLYSTQERRRGVSLCGVGVAFLLSLFGLPVPCAEGTFQDRPLQASCVRCDNSSGLYQPLAGQSRCLQVSPGYHTPSSMDAVPCPPGEYCPGDGHKYACERGTYANGTGQSMCHPCPAGQMALMRGSTECMAPTIWCGYGLCPTCVECGDLLLLGPVLGFSPVILMPVLLPLVCNFCVDSERGTYVTEDVTPTSDRSCAVCPQYSGTFGPNAARCSILYCRHAEYVVVEATHTSDVVCSACSDCMAGTMPSGDGCDGVRDRDCVPCRRADECALLEYLEGVCDPSSLVGPSCRACDHTCASCVGAGSNQCTSCASGRVRDGSGETFSCPQSCGVGTFASNEGVCISCDATCETCAAEGAQMCLACPVGRWMLRRDVGATGQCVTACPTPTHYAWARQCMVLSSPCQPGSYEQVSPSSSSDRVCAPCDAGLTFQPFANQNQCFPVSTCDRVGVVEDIPPTLFADRQCAPCATGTFKTRNGSAPCIAVRICPGGEEEERPPTPSTDRTCRPTSSSDGAAGSTTGGGSSSASKGDGEDASSSVGIIIGIVVACVILSAVFYITQRGRRSFDLTIRYVQCTLWGFVHSFVGRGLSVNVEVVKNSASRAYALCRPAAGSLLCNGGVLCSLRVPSFLLACAQCGGG